MSDFNHALNLTHDGTLILRIPKGYEVYKVVVEEMGTDKRKKFVNMSANISDFCDKLWKLAYERGKAEGQPRRGKWIGYNADDKDWQRDDGTPIFMDCSECHGFVINNTASSWNFCPNCGCRMEEGDAE